MDTDNAVMEERQKRQLAVFWQVICVDPVKTSHVFSVSFTVSNQPEYTLCFLFTMARVWSVYKNSH